MTRIGLGIYSPEWFERMVALFLAVTAPSLSRQTSQDFHWLILVDVALTGAPLRELESLVAAHPNFHLVTMDVTRMTFMRLGGHDWIWEPCHGYILANGLVDDPSEYVITSSIDGDDAWANDYVLTVNAFMAGALPDIERQESERGSHLRHSSGAVLTFSNGLYWFVNTDGMEPLSMAYHSMAISVLARLSSGISTLSNRHLAWPKGAEIADFQVRELGGPHPMWLYVRHDLSVQPWRARPQAGPAPPDVLQALEKAFGIDMEKVRAWRARYPGQDRHPGNSAADQYSRLFRLTALNRQIAALEPAGRDDASAELLARQRAERDRLLEVIYAEGRKH